MGTGKPRRSILSLVLLTLAGWPALAWADPPPELPPHNVLRGVVVDAAGAPVAGAHVALAQADKAWLMFGAGDGVEANGPSQNVLLFFAKRNGRTACNATTDAQGRFALTDFEAPDAAHNLAATLLPAAKKDTPPSGKVALLTDVKPSAYADRELRIELQDAGWVVTEANDWSWSADNVRFTGLALDQPTSVPASGAEAPRPLAVSFTSSTTTAEFGIGVSAKPSKMHHGPLPGGRRYRVSVEGWQRGLPYSPTLFQRVVAVEAGKIHEVDTKVAGDMTMTGRVTGLDGTPLANVNVLAKAGDGNEFVVGALTDQDGRYELVGVPPGARQIELIRYAVRSAPG